MLNWVDVNNRLPTDEDTSKGTLYGVTTDGHVFSTHITHFTKANPHFTHWLPFHEMPIPKRWRVPTIHDLAKAGKPIPCRVRSSVNDEWQHENLCMLSVKSDDQYPYWCDDDSGYKYCEICDA